MSPRKTPLRDDMQFHLEIIFLLTVLYFFAYVIFFFQFDVWRRNVIIILRGVNGQQLVEMVLNAVNDYDQLQTLITLLTI